MFRRYTWSLAAVLSLISPPIFAGEPALPAASGAGEADSRNTVSETDVGLRAFIDEQTGEVRAPTEAEIAEIAEQFRRQYIDSSADKPLVYHPDGSISKELGTHDRMYSVARIGTDGELETHCLPAEQAVDFLSGNESEKPATQVETERDTSQ